MEVYNMVCHISVRLSWHDNGWNGHICKNPKTNTYCVGPYSYPGDLIAQKRDLIWEDNFKGKSCLKAYQKNEKIPPCSYSINAFGKEEIYAESEPPEFFQDNTRTKIWKMPPYSVSTWPYEEMYKEEVKNPDGTYNNKKRLEAAREFFSKLEPGKTLIFYYANYSNPFSEEDRKRYVLVGVSRLKEIGEELFYEGCSEETIKKFAGGFIWQRVLTSYYPEEGLRIPYHIYTNKHEILEKIVLVPDNSRNFKYGTRHMTDDDALELIEKFIEIAETLKEIGDTTENWDERIRWLNSVIAELWKSRGLYPGLLSVLDYIGFDKAIQFYKDKITENSNLEVNLKQKIFGFINEKVSEIDGLPIEENSKKKILRQWKLKTDIERELLENVLPKFDLSKEQIEKILSENRRNYGVYSSLEQIAKNPYILCEEYVGDDPDDFISFNKIDHGVFPSLPSPEFDRTHYSDFEKDDARRLRALCVEQLRKESQHAFMLADYVINKINHKLSYFPERKRAQFNLRYIEVDKDVLSEALEIRKDKQGKTYFYLKANYEYEREIEKRIRDLAKRPDIKLRTPVTEEHWKNFLHGPDSPILKVDPGEYNNILKEQAEICARIFAKSVSVISGGAGTGKTTIIKAIIQAIEKVDGKGVIIKLFAPTGKAADRLREITGREALTIHSFLASQGWLNDNLTFKREGDNQADITTIIIDEASMLDLTLLGTLFRAINWNSVKRLIFVGDPNQLPPIGTGKVFADILDWLQNNYSENVGMLKTNVRQLLNKIENKGKGILELASLYERRKLSEYKDSAKKFKEEKILKKVQEGGNIDKDLRVIYWRDLDDLREKLIDTIVKDLETDTGAKYDPNNPFEICAQAFKIQNYDNQEPDYMQIISPYRGEFFGVDNLNLWIQETFNKYNVENKGTLNGITYFDKVIQYRNRTRSNPIKAYNMQTRQQENVEVFNGEIGFVIPHGLERGKWRLKGFRLFRFQVIFKRKEHLKVNYGTKCAKNNKGQYLNENVEENLELAYAISVHKAQGSEFNRVYFVLPKSRRMLLTTELLYTGLTRAIKHCTLLIEEDISPLLTLLRPEHSQLNKINSSLFEFKPVPQELLNLIDWYEEGKIHKTLAGIMVRSKSEVIIANLLHERSIPFKYENPLYAPDGTFYIPDFTITWEGEDWYWEHLGMLDNDEYRNHWETKKEWYKKHGFSQRVIITDEEEGIDSKKIEYIIKKYFGK
jgi:ATP-dependent exoDNAse (exonuclease V) alpha subunit